MRLLECVETLSGFDLGDAADLLRPLRFTEHRAAIASCVSERRVHDGVASTPSC